MMMTVSSRSSANTLTKGAPIRAVTFQSMVRISSPGIVFAHLQELDAAALEHAVIFAGKDLVHGLARGDLHPAHAAEKFAQRFRFVFRPGSCEAQGTSILSKSA